MVTKGELSLACPSCFSIDNELCQYPNCLLCIDACPAEAIMVTENRPVILSERCISCGICAVSCPTRAIDRPNLVISNDSTNCPHCEAHYPVKDGILVLLSKKTVSIKEQSFYHEEYLDQNPDLHLADSLIKLAHLDWFIKKIKILNIETLLDIGSGAGLIPLEIMKVTTWPLKNIVLSDIAHEHLKMCRSQLGWEKREMIHFLCFDAQYIPFRAQSIDLSLLIDVLEHIPNYEQVIREIGRSCQYLVVKVPLYGCWYQKRISLKEWRKKWARFGHLHRFEIKRLSQEFETNGMHISLQKSRFFGRKESLHACFEYLRWLENRGGDNRKGNRIKNIVISDVQYFIYRLLNLFLPMSLFQRFLPTEAIFLAKSKWENKMPNNQ